MEHKNIKQDTTVSNNENIYPYIEDGNEKDDEDYDDNIKYDIISNKESITQREINGKRSYKTGEVAKMLGETPAMIGFYCREFEQHLNLNHIPGQHRTFNDDNIEILKYIIYLMKDKKMTADQAKEFLSTPQGKLFSPIDNQEDKAKFFVDLITEELKSSIENTIKAQIQDSLQKLMPDIVEGTMDKISSSLLERQKNLEGSLKELVNESITSIQKMGSIVDESNKNIVEVTKQLSTTEQKLFEWREHRVNELKEIEGEDTEKKKGFFSKLFKK